MKIFDPLSFQYLEENCPSGIYPSGSFDKKDADLFSLTPISD